MASVIQIRPFEPSSWSGLWMLRLQQLAEQGVHLDPADISLEPEPVGRDDPEWDYYHLAEVYQRGRGGFWLAWEGDQPMGHVGAQDVGAFLELRRMYMPAAERRRGIGTALVRQLLAYTAAHGVEAVELWTEDRSVGQALYATLGFSVVAAPGIAPAELALLLHWTRGDSEVRMRREVRDIRRVADTRA